MDQRIRNLENDPQRFVGALMKNMEDFYRGSNRAVDQARAATMPPTDQRIDTEIGNSSSDANMYSHGHDDGYFDMTSMWEDEE